MRVLKYIAVLLFCCCLVDVFAQTGRQNEFINLPDSLKPKKYPPTIDELNKIYKNYSFSKADMPLGSFYAGQIVRYVNNNPEYDKEKAIQLYFGLFSFYDKIGSTKLDSLNYINAEIKNRIDKDSASYKNYIGQMVTNIGVTKAYAGQFENAIVYLQQNIGKLGNDTSLLAANYRNLAYAYSKIGSLQHAIEYNKLAIDLLQGNQWLSKKTFVYKLSSNISFLYINEFFFGSQDPKVLDTAEIYLTNAYQRLGKDTLGVSIDYYLRFIVIKYGKGEYNAALDIINIGSLPSIKQANTMVANNNDTSLQILRALVLIKLKHDGEALDVIGKCYNTLEKTGSNSPLLKIAYKEMIPFLQQHGKLEWAFVFQQKFLTQVQNEKKIVEKGLAFEAGQRFDLAQKQATIDQLMSKSQLQKQRQRTFLFIAVSIAIFLVATISLLLLRQRNKKQQFKQEQERQILIDDLNKVESDMADIKAVEQLKRDEVIAQQRIKISRDMHDTINSELAAFKFEVDNLATNSIDEHSKTILQRIAQDAQRIYAETRAFTNKLMGNEAAGTTNYNVNELLNNLTNRFNDEALLKITAQADVKKNTDHFTQLQHYEVYLIIKEAVANAIKHGNATAINISIFETDGLFTLTITDNGYAANKNGVGIGLQSIKQRMENLNGSIEWIFNGEGTIVVGKFPNTFFV